MRYEKWVISYGKDLRLPMMFYTAAVNGVFAFLIAGGLLFIHSSRCHAGISAEPAVLPGGDSSSTPVIS